MKKMYIQLVRKYKLNESNITSRGRVHTFIIKYQTKNYSIFKKTHTDSIMAVYNLAIDYF